MGGRMDDEVGRRASDRVALGKVTNQHLSSEAL
jgi:hypothetical protein